MTRLNVTWQATVIVLCFTLVIPVALIIQHGIAISEAAWPHAAEECGVAIKLVMTLVAIVVLGQVITTPRARRMRVIHNMGLAACFFAASYFISIWFISMHLPERLLSLLMVIPLFLFACGLLWSVKAMAKQKPGVKLETNVGRRDDFEKYLAAVPNVSPLEDDQI